MARRVITERDRGFVCERALALMADGWRIATGPERCRSNRMKRRNASNRKYWRMEMVR